MKKTKKSKEIDLCPDILLNAENRICPQFDNVSINFQKLATTDEMGFRVLDNCTEEHEM